MLSDILSKLKNHPDVINRQGTLKLHEKIKAIIKENPEILGLEKVYVVKEEYPFKSLDGNNMDYQADLIFYGTKSGFEDKAKYYIVEVKCWGIENRILKALDQLGKAERHFINQFSKNFDRIIVYLDPDTSELEFSSYSELRKIYAHV